MVLTKFLLLFLISSCKGEKGFDLYSSSTLFSGYVVVSTIATEPATGPGLVTIFKPDGSFHSLVRDLYTTGMWNSGLVFVPPVSILSVLGGGTQISQVSLLDNVAYNFYTGTRINGNPNRNIVRSSADGSIYLAEQTANTIEKFDSGGTPVGAPFINTTVGSCTLNAPYGMTYISTTQYIAVINSNRLNVYDSTGACSTSVTTAPFNANTPAGIAYQSTTDKLIVTFAGNHSIYACDTNGTNCSQIYLNSAVINTPRAIATDSSGYIYVGSSGTDTVEKLAWTGSGSATRALTGPLIGPSIYSLNPTALLVIP